MLILMVGGTADDKVMGVWVTARLLVVFHFRHWKERGNVK